MVKLSFDIPDEPTQRTLIAITLGLLSIPAMGALDWLSGSDLSFFVFYLIPIFFITWYGGIVPGIVSVVLALLVWLAANILWPTTMQFDPAVVTFFDISEKVVFSCIFLLIIQGVRQLLLREKRISRVDPLTGLGTRAAWLMAIRSQLETGGRPFTAALVTIAQYDDFFLNNGYQSAERLMRNIAAQTRARFPETFRYAVDQLALVLPGKDSSGTAETVRQFRDGLENNLRQQHGVIVSLDICVLPCQAGKTTPVEITLKLHEGMRNVRIKGGHEIGILASSGDDA
jgi:GGDEF domain-containing protein